MWKPSMIPFSPFVSTDFLLSSCPWDEIFLIFYQCLSVNSNSEAFATIPITTIRFHPLICCIHILKVALSFSPETIHSNHSYRVVCRIPPPAIHIRSKMPSWWLQEIPPSIQCSSLLLCFAPTLAFSFQHHPLHLYHFIFGSFLLFHGQVCSWYEKCP